MPLTGQQVKTLRDAIVSAYNGSDLEQLMRFELNERLDNLVSTNAPLPQIVLDLINWAEMNGRTPDLVAALRRTRPKNSQIQTVANDLFPQTPAGVAAVAGSAQLDGPRRARLRAVLLEQFPTRTALKMLLDDALSVNLDSVAAGTNLTETVFELIQWVSIPPAAQLRALLDAAISQRQTSAELKSLRTELFGN